MKAALRLLPLLVPLCACEQVIEPDLPEHPPRLVLHAFFTSEGAWTANVGRSSWILEPRSFYDPPVADATVELLAGEGVVGELEFNEWAHGYVFEGGPLQAGESYSLRATAPDFETVRATDTLPGPVPTSVRLYRPHASAGSESGAGRDFSIELEIQDPPGEANYYQISLFRVYAGRGEEDEARDFIPASRQEEYFSTRDPSILADNSFDGSPFEEGDFEGKAPYFKDTLFDGSTHEIELSTNFDGDPDFSEIRLQVLHISEAYYQYLKTARLHDDTLDNPFAEPLNVYGNVENGYGIFAGYSSRTFELTLDE